MSPSTGTMEKELLRGASAPRQRRRKRLTEKNKSLEHANISADATAETTVLSTETSETMSDNCTQVRKVSLTPIISSLPASEIERGLLPQPVLTTTQTFPPPESLADPSTKVAKPESSPSVAVLPRQESSSLWDERKRKECNRQKLIRKISPAPPRVLSLPLDDAECPPKPKIKPKPKLSKPKLGRYSSAPPTATKQTNVVDDVLMDRAFIIRQNLMNFEMQELAAEAEKAAESGLERFVGSTSKFGVEDTPPYRSKFVDDGEFVVNEGFGTPSRRTSSFVDTLTHPMDYTPSYFSRKKIPVTALRNFSEIVPNFCDLHQNIRLHLKQKGVDLNTLPELHSRRSLIKNDTDESEKDGEDAISQAPSHAESISSFSSYAVASLASLKEIIEYVNRPRTSADNNLKTASSVSIVSHNSIPEENDAKRSKLPKMNLGLATQKKKGINISLPHTSTHFRPAGSCANSDSDDSSVEFYGRKSPIDLNQSASSNMREIIGMNHQISTLPRSRSNTSLAPVKQGNVSFKTEKAGYQTLLDKMHHHASPNISFDADQNSCAPSLANTLELDLLPSSSPTNSAKSTSMAKFLNKIGFSRSASTDFRQKSNDVDVDNQQFLANFFYTNEASHEDSNYLSNLKLDINPEQKRNPFCFSGCGSSSLLPNSACDTATKYVDFVFGLFHVGCDQSKRGNAILDPKATHVLTKNGHRLFTPPKLSVKHSVSHDDDIFCSPDSTKLGNDCEDKMACLEVREQISCPEILNKTGCSQE